VRTVLVISDADNVATALEDLEPGTRLTIGGHDIAVLERVARGHKVSLRAIGQGEAVVKYGSPIGTATTQIEAGRHVHVHNVASARGRGDLSSRGARETVIAAPRIAEPPDVLTDSEELP
jgi:altronate hydrolase